MTAPFLIFAGLSCVAFGLIETMAWQYLIVRGWDPVRATIRTRIRPRYRRRGPTGRPRLTFPPSLRLLIQSANPHGRSPRQ